MSICTAHHADRIHPCRKVNSENSLFDGYNELIKPANMDAAEQSLDGARVAMRQGLEAKR